jgi:hypothetical protein
MSEICSLHFLSLRLGTFAWDLLAWELSIGIFRFEAFAWQLSRRNFRFGSVAWELSNVTVDRNRVVKFRLGSFALKLLF